MRKYGIKAWEIKCLMCGTGEITRAAEENLNAIFTRVNIAFWKGSCNLFNQAILLLETIPQVMVM